MAPSKNHMIPSDQLEVASDLPNIEFDIKEKRVDFDKQQTLFRINKRGTHIDMGYFFEMLTSVLFSGQVQNKLYIKRKKAPHAYGDFHPDVINEETNTMVESKAVVVTNGYLNLYDHQVEKYESHQFYNHTDVKIYWIVFIHSLIKVHSFKGSKKSMFQILGKYTNAGIILPFSLIHALWKNTWNHDEFVYRYDNHNHWPGTYIRKKTLKRIVVDPIRTIRSMGIDQSRYLYYKTQIPNGVVVNNQRITPFPVIYIKDKDHGAWLEKFKTKLGNSSDYERIAF